jgi:hypothetical protein
MSRQDTRTCLDLRLGAPIVCRDGHEGRVTRLAVAPGQQHVAHIVVAHGLWRHEAVVPIDRVTQEPDGRLRLTLTMDELAAAPRCTDLAYATVDPSWAHRWHTPFFGTTVDDPRHAPDGVPAGAAQADLYVSAHAHLGVSPDEILLGRATRIESHEGRLGMLDHVVLEEPGDTMQSLVVRTGRLHGKAVIVPAEQIERIDEGSIAISADAAQVRTLPTYHGQHRWRGA